MYSFHGSSLAQVSYKLCTYTYILHTLHTTVQCHENRITTHARETSSATSSAQSTRKLLCTTYMDAVLRVVERDSGLTTQVVNYSYLYVCAHVSSTETKRVFINSSHTILSQVCNENSCYICMYTHNSVIPKHGKRKGE